ncbi:hypothetical protein A3H22_02800 [Candidatus Peribacteria bacterium RIFCSPLOWO2_12_FULL_55_15]|nr:MAG: hypothetical protein A2789_04185 [Candidatus Peribacteria bacterium RIFCSPHIGHO2_01_FULL_54_22]OGJ63275.1 MAG: hypothetical protein A3D12_03010 [Candidatus Peribacteria bacterium RIFCSPHIGHO2_02_FULL_55_24]OGJ68551.1 MAG: hypothetical protein A2947_00550 [Candidatus Peribacteria bacterium RIFCSPLOWO2_01_FULL_54_110]OGJ70425.1 MAG: hypothetical protein A3H90_01770 [Candidatus Peribacteria bacterium RIFCSPLOWO2_02_FULL_55_36]OGJ70586.1 MAG: hypothetical protein A3H22_02800 [Candidatus Per
MGRTLQNVPVRAVVARFSYDVSHMVMEGVLKRRPFEFCAIISIGTEPRYFQSLPERQQEWFCSAQIRGCHYEDADWDALAPIDAELIEKMRHYESIFMDAVTRLEWKRSIPHATRKRWYLRHLRFWNDYLTRKRINLYLSAWIPHELPDVILYGLCTVRGIPVLSFHSSSLRDTAFPEHAWEDSAAVIQQRYGELLQEYAGVTDLKRITLIPEFDERFRALTTVSGQKPFAEGVRRPTEREKIHELLLARPLKFLRHGFEYLTPCGMLRAVGALQRWKRIRTRRSFYDAHAIDPNLSLPFIYFPLHFQPEASTLPMGGAFVDQSIVAQLLNAYLPDNVLIYVKEHPRESAWVSRSVDYYKDFLELKKVRLIARHIDTFVLREHCRAVATVTGTAGFEALFRGKPVFLFGWRYYQYARGVFRIRSAGDCKDAVHAVFERGMKPTLIESRLYLKAMEETRIHGLMDPWHLKVTKLSDEEHVRANILAILGELERRSSAIAAVP